MGCSRCNLPVNIRPPLCGANHSAESALHQVVNCIYYLRLEAATMGLAAIAVEITLQC